MKCHYRAYANEQGDIRYLSNKYAEYLNETQNNGYDLEREMTFLNVVEEVLDDHVYGIDPDLL